MICDKYTLLSLFIINTVNIIQFVLYNVCIIINNHHPDIHTIRILIYAKILYDIFNFYKLYVCFAHLNNRLHRDLIDFIAYGTKFVHVPLLPLLLTYYRLYYSYEQIQTYTNSLMYVLFMLNYYVSYIVMYSFFILIFYYLGNICCKYVNRIIRFLLNKKQYSKSTTETCSICFDVNCNYKTICGHFFHSRCIMQWVTISNKYECPICRNNISYQPYK
jgi:hypothetical protein